MTSLSLSTAAASRLLPSAAASSAVKFSVSSSSSAQSIKLLRSSPLVSHLFLPRVSFSAFLRSHSFFTWLFTYICFLLVFSQKKAPASGLLRNGSSSYSTVSAPKCFASNPEQLKSAREDIKEILKSKFSHPILVIFTFFLLFIFFVFISFWSISVFKFV